jgi:predicted nucleic acid-binding protein
MSRLKIACEAAACLPHTALTEFQGELKSLSTEDYAKLRGQLEHGYSFPIAIWRAPDGLNYILDGHQRLRTIRRMEADGWEIPDLPVSFTEAATYKEAKAKLLAAASQYGKVESQGLYEFMTEAELALQDIMAANRFPEIDFDDFTSEYFSETEGNTDPKKDEDYYSKKIKAPIYEPSDHKPSLSELVDDSKYMELIAEIERAELDEQMKAFLKIAAARHYKFSYAKIANFYAHSPKEVQELMENSALVIIDFKKAIEKGFVSLTNHLSEAYLNYEK